MSEKHYPYIGGSFDRIVFDGDGSVWAPEPENAKLRELVIDMMRFFEDGDWCTECDHARECESQEQYEDDCLMRFVFRDRMHELGIEVTDA